MNQNPLIKKIKKCKHESRIITLQETEDEIGVKERFCSTFLSLSGLLAQGEIENPKSDERNAMVTFRDPATGKLKGRDSGFCEMFFAFLFICLYCNTLGRAITGNKRDVYSMICFLYKEKQYLGVSGDWDIFEVFDVSKLKAYEFLSK